MADEGYRIDVPMCHVQDVYETLRAALRDATLKLKAQGVPAVVGNPACALATAVLLFDELRFFATPEEYAQFLSAGQALANAAATEQEKVHVATPKVERQ